ncbi:GntR family transcriptional regulator [Microbacterium sp. Marseille-Q6965]|uniref:GntR family transcriptional regulator n=1 Tax=Microbacterium sp. Marseille-Q6965 TaxID=2965072 RepID=UPI0021B7EE58|nr:GntR family transcriptional regulator [Microbacterium sp. Marseille-Q6965]
MTMSDVDPHALQKPEGAAFLSSLNEALEPEPQRLGDAVFEQIGEAIVEGRLAPGERIRDVDIAAELGVSRMPVREALQRLERIGLVEMSASRFTRVTRISPEEVDAAMEYLGYQVGISARMAAERMSDEELARAVALSTTTVEVCRGTDPADSLAHPMDTVFTIYDTLNELYSHLADSCGNLVFTRAYREAWFGLRRAQRGRPQLIQTPAAIADAFDEFARVLAARDSAAAEAVIRRIFRIDPADA